MINYTHRYRKECKHAVIQKDGTVYCRRDGSIRKNGCPCAHHTFSWWAKLKHKLGF